jgi:hypothetical protein
MAEREEARVQLATRIPKRLHRRLKPHCVERDIPIMAFVVAAVEEKLRRQVGTPRRRRGR